MEIGSDIKIQDSTMIVMNLGMMVTFITFYTKLVSDHVRLKIVQEFQEKSLNNAHEKIRDLEKRKNG